MKYIKLDDDINIILGEYSLYLMYESDLVDLSLKLNDNNARKLVSILTQYLQDKGINND